MLCSYNYTDYVTSIVRWFGFSYLISLIVIPSGVTYYYRSTTVYDYILGRNQRIVKCVGFEVSCRLLYLQ